MSVQQKSRLDIHQQVTAKIIAAIEAGVAEWRMPWHRPGTAFSIPRNALTGKGYRGINVLSLWIDADAKKFEHQIWASYKQWAQLGAQVHGGEKGSLIVKYGEWTPKHACEQESDADEPVTRIYARPAWVFNVDQVSGYQLPSTTPRADLTTRLAHVDQFLANTKAEFRYGGQRAFYRHRASDGSGDFIQIPDRTMFTGTATSTPTEAFEATRAHEVLHWSGAEHRLDREFGKRFADRAHAFEEIVVELGAAALCAHLDIANEPRADHAQYIAHWLAILKSDSKAIFSASAHASRAVDYLFALQPKAEGEPS